MVSNSSLSVALSLADAVGPGDGLTGEGRFDLSNWRVAINCSGVVVSRLGSSRFKLGATTRRRASALCKRCSRASIYCG